MLAAFGSLHERTQGARWYESICHLGSRHLDDRIKSQNVVPTMVCSRSGLPGSIMLQCSW